MWKLPRLLDGCPSVLARPVQALESRGYDTRNGLWHRPVHLVPEGAKHGGDRCELDDTCRPRSPYARWLWSRLALAERRIHHGRMTRRPPRRRRRPVRASRRHVALGAAPVDPTISQPPSVTNQPAPPETSATSADPAFGTVVLRTVTLRGDAVPNVPVHLARYAPCDSASGDLPEGTTEMERWSGTTEHRQPQRPPRRRPYPGCRAGRQWWGARDGRHRRNRAVARRCQGLTDRP